MWFTYTLLLSSLLYSSLLFSSPFPARLRLSGPLKNPDLYSTPATGGRQLKEEVHYENAELELYENMPSPKLAKRYPPKTGRTASPSSSSAGHYKTPVSSKALSSSPANANSPSQVTNLSSLLSMCGAAFTSVNHLWDSQHCIY